MLDLSSCAAANFCAPFATLARASSIRDVQLADLVNHVPVQPDEHHALDLTCKRVAVQITTEVGER